MTAATPPLALTPVGVGAAYGAPGEAQSCHLVRAGGRTVVLDMGSGTLNRLCAHVAPEDVDLLVVSHVHPDHCADLLALRVYMVWGPGRGRRLRVRCPGDLRDRLAAFGEDGLDEAFAFEPMEGPTAVTDLGDGVRVRHAAVPHIPGTYATRVDHAGRSLCFGADCGPNAALADLAHGVDLLVTECSFGADPVPDGVQHLNAAAAGRIAREAGAGRLLLVHGLPEFDRDAAPGVASEAAGVPAAWAVAGREEPA
jgi:ribonuclease BN (tRNA processing enzyme)